MRYFAYVTDDKWNLNMLLSSERIKATFNSLPLEYAAFASIQNYDAKGRIISCPLYIDVDSSSLYDAWNSTKNAWTNLKSDFNIEPFVYFSGSKGFHIIMPLLIKHERCHEIARSIALDYCVDLDTSVYSTRRMWRCNGSIHTKTGMFKVRVSDITMSLEDILKLAESGGKERVKPNGFTYQNSTLFNNLVEEEVSTLRMIKTMPVFGNTVPVDLKDQKGCIKTLWLKESFDEGERHDTLFLLARTTIKAGLTENQALDLFLNHPFWGKHYPEGLVKKVVYSAYKCSSVGWQCKRGRDSELLTPHCVGSSCFYHKDFIIGLSGSQACGII